METWYLFLGLRLGDKPWISRRCQAATKEQAAGIFANRLNMHEAKQVYTETEVLPAIKRQDELTNQEQQWLAAEPPALLDL